MLSLGLKKFHKNLVATFAEIFCSFSATFYHLGSRGTATFAKKCRINCALAHSLTHSLLYSLTPFLIYSLTYIHHQVPPQETLNHLHNTLKCLHTSSLRNQRKYEELTRDFNLTTGLNRLTSLRILQNIHHMSGHLKRSRTCPCMYCSKHFRRHNKTRDLRRLSRDQTFHSNLDAISSSSSPMNNTGSSIPLPNSHSSPLLHVSHQITSHQATTQLTYTSKVWSQ